MAETSATFTKAVLHVDANFLQHDAKYSSAEPAADDGENHEYDLGGLSMRHVTSLSFAFIGLVAHEPVIHTPFR